MKNILLHHPSSLWERFLDSNPQLFREIKGKLKTRNVIIAAAISTIVQFVVVISLLGELPDPEREGVSYQPLPSGRYGFGNGYGDRWAYTKDMFDNWVINWQLLWLDLFIALSIISIFALLIVGTYMLVTDTVKEESRGTLNFIRLSPQSAGSILLGKVLGVPILLYTVILLFLPLHFVAGLSARIPLPLVLSFYGVTIASCAFFYSLALLWSLMNFGAGFKPWLASGAVGLFLFTLTTAMFHHSSLITNTLWDWLYLFNPSIVLSYLIDSTHLPRHRVDFLPVENLGELMFYGQAWWTSASLGISFIFFNLSLWTYWCWSLTKRRFRNPQHTLVSKAQSYWITCWMAIIALGFTLQSTTDYRLKDNFIFLQFCLGVLGLALIAALSPHRQALHDWARYRHQKSREGNVLWKELIFGENSPSTVAIAINLAMAIAYIAPSILLHLNPEHYHILSGFILSAGIIILCAIAAQLILTFKTRKRSALSIITVASIIVVPPLCFGFADIYPGTMSQAWLLSFVPTVATEFVNMSAVMFTILGQWLAIALIGFQMTRRLKQAGASETKMLLDRTKA